MKTAATLLSAAVVAASLSACAQGPVSRDQLVAQPSACGPRGFEVYFAENAAQLTQPARQAIDLMADQMADCAISKVTVIGLASATGTPEANLSLSQRRAQTVAAEFARKGWPAPAFELEAAGDAGAVAADGTMEPLRRRTQVFIEAAPR
ncbi:MAG TPA: OmpA family protein [Brevundimonas sp.]|jgi:outer membrane protein OmpA-like peptidoglycan-associated protein|uniref:OmpA family protein n=1 Tax=Brevundimonas sp. TaxID=1871086 RepID=UPI002DE81230|nr:OmpA family protein [Brevundimonas sp.]